MRSVFTVLLGYVLALLLLGTSPVGTGQGAHQNQLLDALIPHVHFDGGRLIQTSTAPAYGHGPALGAGAAAAAGALGLALTPPVPSRSMTLVVVSERWFVSIEDDARPPDQTEAPPDPPPSSIGPVRI